MIIIICLFLHFFSHFLQMFKTHKCHFKGIFDITQKEHYKIRGINPFYPTLYNLIFLNLKNDEMRRWGDKALRKKDLNLALVSKVILFNGSFILS